jgi:hypothetical protein
MSLYRQTGTSLTTRVVVGGVVGLIVLAAGYGLGRATAPSTSLEDNVASVRKEASVITDALELVPLHYDSSNATTRQGARDQLDRAVEQFRAVEPELALLDSEATTAASSALEDLQRLANDNAAPSEVDSAAARARDAVRTAARLE